MKEELYLIHIWTCLKDNTRASRSSTSDDVEYVHVTPGNDINNDLLSPSKTKGKLTIIFAEAGQTHKIICT